MELPCRFPPTFTWTLVGAAKSNPEKTSISGEGTDFVVLDLAVDVAAKRESKEEQKQEGER